MKTHRFHLPLRPDDIGQLTVGDKVLLSGVLYTARDQAHKRLCQMIQNKVPLPFDLSQICLFYAGPTPKPPDKTCGAIGPTTSRRMDPYTPILLDQGLKIMIGKGERSPEVTQAILTHQALYLVSIGGISALLSQKVSSIRLFLWEDLGPEAIYRLEVMDFPAYVALV
ncbi:MAG: FumA C-terminus/TtdB family hydratase beta subunit [Candidatus Cloacimonetes bacterium]|nr:FumA C-terminus/TtdB family hydratase beta subunit [Candidatus Cloacimonadota bacterium]